MATGRILVVDDEAFFQELFREVLSSAGHATRVASSADEALQLLAKDHFDLLVTDIVMPGMTGRELAEALTAERPGIRVLYMSGYTDDAVVRPGVLDSDVAFLQKPITPETLTRKVREVIESRSSSVRAADAEAKNAIA